MNTLVSKNSLSSVHSHKSSLIVSVTKAIRNVILNTFVDLTLPILGIQIMTKGKFPTQGAFMIVANHNSHADTPILLKTLQKEQREKCKIVASKKYFFDSNKLSRKLARMLFPLVPATAAKVLNSIQQSKKNENVFLIYPEGTRGLTPHINTFKPGIKTMLETTNIPVVPVAISGSRKILKPGSIIPRSGNVIVSIGNPITPSEFSAHLVEQIEDKVKTLYESEAIF